MDSLTDEKPEAGACPPSYGGGLSCGAPSACGAPGAPDGSDAPTCRLCWAEADCDPGGELLAPCACRGSLRFVHARCLAAWRRVQRAQGLRERAGRCELCRARYSGPPPEPCCGRDSDAGEEACPPQHRAAAAGRRALPLLHRLARAARRALKDAADPRRWPALALRVWRAHLLATAAVRGLRAGAEGFAAGAALGRELVGEQAALLGGALSPGPGGGEVLGGPYSELLWAQVAGAVLAGCAIELLQIAVLGGVGGLAYGFASGYASAVSGSARAAGRVGRVALRGAARATAGVLRFALPA
ncbi:hypothetical protein Rsub_00056 [Raphidocelis subcapitata]|uniref:RING-CH-type domain-containing protein n=1 Tax=Raphidocelis subcapitata TaxID=307507 RepID=A0A2V0NR81_9CHLO|nr:hypothetical protein Rsub_00056 [Raphidocelis subcapitata]|eukprot:GBF87345.1 hypothetical protein Rsub_00056 [Raphidocelis subcapitata]